MSRELCLYLVDYGVSRGLEIMDYDKSNVWHSVSKRLVDNVRDLDEMNDAKGKEILSRWYASNDDYAILYREGEELYVVSHTGDGVYSGVLPMAENDAVNYSVIVGGSNGDNTNGIYVAALYSNRAVVTPIWNK